MALHRTLRQTGVKHRGKDLSEKGTYRDTHGIYFSAFFEAVSRIMSKSRASGFY